jgi:cysteine synthase
LTACLSGDAVPSQVRLACSQDERISLRKAAAQNINIIRAYGAEIDIVMEPDADTGEFLQARLSRVDALLRSIGNGYWPNQYANYHNALSHQDTMRRSSPKWAKASTTSSA